MSTIGTFARHTVENADRPALSCGDRTLAYAELGAAVAAVAGALTGLGVRAHDRVAVVARRGERMIVAELAALALGAAFVPIDRANPDGRLRVLLADADARCVVSCDEPFPTDLPVLDLRVLPSTMDGLAPAPVGPDAAAYCLYTSGTSGTPKAVVVEDGGLVNLCDGFIDPLFAIEGVQTVGLVAPFAFDASIKMIYGALTTGRHLRVLTEDERDDVTSLAGRLAEWGVDALDCTPTYLGVLCDAWERHAVKPPRLRCVLVGGEALDSGLADRAAMLTGAVVYNVYGPTEATVDATCHRHEPGEAMSIGRPIPGAKVLIVRNGRAVGRGLPGEIWIGGAGVARGYLNAPETTAEKFVSDPFGEGSGRFYRTGDRGRTRPDGALEYLGRLDEQVKVRGFRIEPDEIARTAEALPGVGSAGAVLTDSGVLVVFYSGAGSSDADVLTGLRAALPEHMVPAHAVRVDRLPLTGNGKLDRAALRAWTPPRADAPASVAPSTPEEAAVAVAIGEVLHLDEVSVDANFFLLGGDSIKAILVVSALAQRGHRLAVRDVMTSLTPAEMAARVTPLTLAAPTASAEGVVPPTPITADFFARGYAEPHHHHQTAELPLDPAAIPHLPRALRELASRHRILTAVVRGDRLVVPPAAEAAAPTVDEWDLHGDGADAELARRATALCASTDLAAGPLVRAAVVRTGDRTALFLAIHHLVVDAVSWHVLRRDLAALTEALIDGAPLPPAPTGASFREWATALTETAFTKDVSPLADRERARRAAILRDAPALPALGEPDGRRRDLRIVLDAETTAALVAPRASDRDPDPQDVLVAAVTAAAHRVWGLDRVPLTTESHGRTGDRAGDVSGAVGWFTATHPVLVDVRDDPAAQLRAARDALGRIPDAPVGGDAVETLGVVNYLGDQDGPGLNPYGAASSPLNVDPARLAVDAAVVGGRLTVDLGLRRDAATTEQADVFASTLRTALTRYADPAARAGLAPVPADFGLDAVTVDELDALFGDRTACARAVYPLSPLQQGMLYEHMRGVGDHVVQVEYAFDAPSDPERLARATAELARLTPALRTVVAWDAEIAPHQAVLADLGADFAHHDHRGLSEQDSADAFSRHCADRLDRPFDLRHGPLFRCDAFTVADGVHRLVFTHHHVILDGWSLAELCARFAAIHHALGDPSAHMPAGETDGGPIPTYGEHLRLAAARDGDAFDAYWTELLDGYEGGATITGVDPDPAPGTGRHTTVSATGLAARLHRACSPHGVTLAHAAEAAWGLVLSRVTGSQDVVFGKVVSGRTMPMQGIEKTVGLFINTIPVRVRIDPAATVADLAREVGAQALASAEHDHGSLARVRSLVGVEDLVGCVFAVENYHVDEAAPGLPALEFRWAREATNYPLTVTVQRTGDEVEVVVLHDRAVLGDSDAERIAGRLLTVLEGFTSEAAVAEVSSLLPDETAVLDGFNDTVAEYPRDGSIGEVFARTAAGHPDRIALVADGRRLTYGELASDAAGVAAALAGAGVRVGEPVGLIGEPGVELFTGLLGIVLSGAAYVPIDVDAPVTRAAAIAADAGLSVVVSAGERGAEAAAEIAPEARILDVATAVAGEYPSAEVSEVPGGGDTAYVMFTSGTTGRPKGSVIPQRAVLRLVCGNPSLPLGPEDVLIQTGSVAFDASTFEVWGMWLNGGTLVIPDREDLLSPDRLGGLIREHGATVMWLTVSLFNQYAVTDPGVFAGLGRLLIGGEAVSGEHVRRVHAANPQITIINGYGPTENTTFTTTHPIPRGFDRIPIGRPIGGTGALILDGSRTCGIGEIGELCATGDGLSTGYLAMPELTAERFVLHDGVRAYRTGDRARWLPDGTIEYLGRVDDAQVKLRGYRIELGDIETALRSHPDVRDAVVIVRRTEEGTTLVGYAVAVLDPGDLRSHLSELLPAYMVPAHLLVIDAIPLTRNGKIDRRALPDPERPAVDAAPEEPANEAERVVRAAFADILGLPAVGPSDSFFELGGDSIKAIRVVSRIRQAGFEVGVGAVMAAGTARGVAARTERAVVSAYEQGEVTGAAGGVLPIVAEFFAWDLAVPGHFNQDVVLDLGDVAADRVRAALDAVWRHHDALRAVVADGTLHMRPSSASYGFEHVTADEADSALDELADRLHASMDLTEGPLFQAGLVTSPNGSRLFLAAHHLVVDAVSWDVVVEDVLAALRSPSSAPPEKTASLRDWAHALSELTGVLVPREQAYWDRVETRAAGAHFLGDGTGEPGELQFTVDADATAALTAAARVYRAEVEDLLLAGLATSLRGLTSGEVAVRLERHGRSGHPSLPAADRTVGWFTTMFPVVVPCAADPRDAIVEAKEAVRGVPAEGIGYGLRPGGFDRIDAPVTLNYLGRRDDSVLFGRTGTPSHPANRHRRGITVDAAIRGSRLTVTLAHDGTTLSTDGADRLAARYRDALAALTAHCLALRGREWTPSDLTAATGLSRADLRTILAAHPAAETDAIETIADLSPLQEGMLLHGLGDDDGAYVVQQVFRAGDDGGAFDVDRVAAAVAAVGRAHPILRTVFLSDGLERPRQVVLADREIPFTVVDLRDPAGLDALLAEDVARGFDLAGDPLLRVTAVRTVEDGSAVTRLVWTYHHIVLDGWSLSTLFGDFLRVYRDPSARLGDDGAPAYSAYVRHLAERDSAAFETYWTGLLDGYDTVAALTSTAVPDRGATGVGRIERTTGGSLARRLTSRFAARGITLAHLAETAWGLVLSRAIGSPDVVFGKVVSGRDVPLQGIDRTVGLFINTVPVRVRIDPAAPVGALLDAVRDQAVASAEHDHGSLARIRALAGTERLVSTLFAFENFHREAGVLEGGGLEFERGREQTTYPFNLVAQRDGDELAFTVLHDPAVLATSTVERLLGRVVSVLEGLADGVDGPVGELSTLLPGEGELVREVFNRTALPYPGGMTGVSAFLDGVREHPGRVALVWGEREMTYAEVAEAALHIARRLVAHGVPAGSPVGILGDRSSHVIAGILGTMMAGCHFIPLDVTAPAVRLGQIVVDSGMRCVLTYGPSAEKSATAMDGDLPVMDLAEVLSGGSDETTSVPEAVRALGRAPGSGDLAYCIYTSGTTGTPKGVMLTHKGLANLRAHLRETYRVTGNDRVLQFSNLTFDASVWEIALSLLNGAGLVIVDQDTIYDATALSAEARRAEVTLGLLPPQYYLLCEGLPHRIITTGGGASSGAVVEKARREGVGYVNAYGPTETTVLATGWVDAGEPLVDETHVPIGVPVANTQVHILDGDRLCGIGEIGELCAAGDGVSAGYVGLPELTAEKFTPNPFGAGRLYRTGDRARRLDDGTVQFLGRVDDRQVKIRGHRIELPEIETVLRAHESVRDAVVVVHTETDESSSLSAYVVPDTTVDVDDLRFFLGERLPGYMVPAYLTVIASVPLTRHGKLDRAALPAPVPSAGANVDAETDAERAVCAAFADVLGVDGIGATDSFFEWGGDSIKAIRVVSRVRTAGYEVSVGAVMAGMTARGVAARLRRSEGNTAEQGEVVGPVGPSPMVSAFFDWDLAVPAHFNQDAVLPVGNATVAEVRAALDAVWAHHDALRAVVGDRGLVLRAVADGSYGFAHGGSLPELAARLHASMDLVDGPLFQAALTDDGALFLAAHHLVVDAVSWQILLEDLRAGLAAVRAGTPVALPAKTTSVRDFAENLRKLGETLVPAERSYWDGVDAASPAATPPRDHTRPGHTGVVETVLDTALTEAVLSAGSTYHATVEDVLLAALTTGLGALTGLARVAIRLEGHGRSAHDALPATDRTVGWFTAMYPVVLDVHTTPGDALVATKETLRAVPHRGIGYGLRPGGYTNLRASITFNYLGAQDDGFMAEGVIPSHPDNHVLEGIRINVFVRAGQLTTSIAYEDHTLTNTQATQLAELYQHALEALAEHCRGGEAHRTRSDTDAADLSGEDLDLLNTLFGG